MHLLLRPLCCQNAGHRLWPNGVKDFKSIRAAYVLHPITRQGCLRAGGRIQPATSLNLGTSQSWEADVGAALEKIGRKSQLSGYSITLDFWKNSFLFVLYSCSTKPCLVFHADHSLRWLLRNRKYLREKFLLLSRFTKHFSEQNWTAIG